MQQSNWQIDSFTLKTNGCDGYKTSVNILALDVTDTSRHARLD
jgi:hypothetical protein